MSDWVLSTIDFNSACSAAGTPTPRWVILPESLQPNLAVSFGDPGRTLQVIERVQRDGACWCGPTEWQGHTAMRISVSSWATRDEDVDRSVASILRAASD